MTWSARSPPGATRSAESAATGALAWVVLGLGLALLGCGHASEPGAIQIGILVNLTAAEGQSTIKAAELAVDAANAAGGLEVDGRRHRVELLYEDTRALPGEAIDGARRLVQRGVTTMLGPSRSRDAIAAAGVVENARIPMISAASTHPETTAGRRYVFRTTFLDVAEGEALGRFAVDALDGRSAAVLYDVASAYNRSLATVFRRAFEAAGGSLVAFEAYTTGDLDFSQQLERIHATRPEILFLPNYYEEIPRQAQQARDRGIDATLIGGDSWALLSDEGLAQVEGAFFGQHWHLDQSESNPVGQRFVDTFRQAHGHDPSSQAALVYDSVCLLLEAVRRGGQDPDTVRNELALIEDYHGVTGPITFFR
ncbi:MAG: ABC transporter substrate-binding protein, partial [Acidobacteriota bacterium]